MDRRQDKDLTLAEFKIWVERKFEDLEKKNQQIVTDVQGATGQTDVSSAGVAGWDLMEENPPSDYYDSQRESASAHGQFEKEASKPLKIVEPGDPSIQQMLLEILDRQQKVERQISAVNGTLEKEKRFMRDELRNTQGDIIKRLENIKYQTTHFENRFHELAEKLENKVEETRTVTENQISDCAGVMSQTVRDMTSKVEQEIKTVQACVQQCQLSPNKQDLNIPNLKVLMGEVLKDFLHPVEKAVAKQGQLEKLSSLVIKQEIEQLNIKLDGISSKLTDQNQAREDQLKTHVAEQIQTPKQSLETKLSQNVRDSETRITVVEYHVKIIFCFFCFIIITMFLFLFPVTLQTSKQSLETKLSQNLRDSETRIAGNINTVTARLEENLTQQNQKSEKSLKDEMGKVKDETIQQIKQASNESCQSTKTEIQTNLKTNTETMKDFMTCVKRELFKFIEKESSITRIKITDPTTQVRSSTFDFYVKNFKDLVKSGKSAYSVPWYIDEFKSSVEGIVYFTPNGEIEVWLIYGRHYLEMGLKPRRVKLRVRATITDRSGVLPDLLVGEETWYWNEEDVRDNRNWGRPLGTLKCQDVIQKGYDKCKGYGFDSLLVRYHIDVV